jgi:SWI/SNF-related matrix-associated actin-dependent regulator 1 of chromatin subfamily A
MPARVIRVKGKSYIALSFRYDPRLVAMCKSIPDYKWKPELKEWWYPATAWHGMKVIETFSNDLEIQRTVTNLADDLHRDYVNSTNEYLEGLHPFQKAGVDFLLAHNGRGLICDSPGLGKTVQTLAFMDRTAAYPCLVVCPSSVTFKWQEEVTKWVGRTSEVITSGKQEITGEDFIIMSYGMAVSHYATLTSMELQTVVLDEFHYIKNPKAQRTRAMRKICAGVPNIVGLSGTPLLNKPKELYNMLNILNRNVWNWYQFGQRYCLDDAGHYDGQRNLGELSDRLLEFSVRRTKQEVLEQLPDLTRTLIPVDVDISLYSKLKADRPEAIQQLFPHKTEFDGPLDKLTALRMAIGWAKVPVAINVAKDLLESMSGKLVLYCVHKQVVMALEAGLREYGVLQITGEVSQKKRQESVHKFQEDSMHRIMIITSAGGEGIDLFGLNGNDNSRIIFVEREWTPAKEEQAEGRLHRMGQHNAVEAIYLVARGTVDSVQHELIERKRELVDVVIGNEETLSIQKELMEWLKKGE